MVARPRKRGDTAEGLPGGGNASIHIHPGVATGALITCFNLPTADWASICHSKSVIARGTVLPPPPLFLPFPVLSWPVHVDVPRGWGGFSCFEHCYYFLIARLALSRWLSGYGLPAYSGLIG